MKKILLAVLLWPLVALAQTFTYPSVTFQDLTVLGTLYGASINLGPQAGNTVLANATGSSAPPTAFSMPGCSSSTSALQWTSGSGFSCNSAVTAGTIAPTAWASPGTIGSTSPNTGAFTSLATGNISLTNTSGQALVINSTGNTTAGAQVELQGNGATTPNKYLRAFSGHLQCVNSANTAVICDIDDAGNTSFSGTVSGSSFPSPSLTGTPTAPTASLGTSSTQIATTAFVANHAPCPSILDHGGDNTNTNDNTSAFAATAAVGPSGQACVYFPPGVYKFSSAVSYSLPSTTASITIHGAAADQSKLVWASGGGMTITYNGPYNAVHISGLSFLTGSVGSGTALSLSQSSSSIPNPANTALTDITNVTIRGSDGYEVSDYWANGISISGVSNVNIFNSIIDGATTSSGVGVYLIGTANAQAVAINIQNCFIQALGNGVKYNNYVQGVNVTNNNFTGVGYGVYVSTPAAGQDQLTVIGNQFNSVNSGVFDTAGVTDTMIHGNLFIVPYSGSAVSGINLTATNGFTIMGNTFGRIGGSATNTNGIIIGGTTPVAGVITGNMFEGFGTAVWLQTGSSTVSVQSNYYSGNTANVTNNGTGNVVGVASP
ncbi:hypothetical protein [Paraburkholderia unamae]|uniref:Parallel beta helix pectate lyase-like protein n=1 Tax=Paraburkholderia unamae TaxID=219649 RepID=A0ABX5KHB4_9BURK|nr:hypothetical protein [Paraburkholderia unamae]PVX77152.1 hypothetical protein C7402_115211 [Paraburkholderia unamae]